MAKELKFIHITKTAGTSIEDCAHKKNINFGRFHKEYGQWHNFFPNKPLELKLKYDWFLVVRNPYSRIISEYHCKWGGIGKNNVVHTKEEMNKYIVNKINKRSKDGYHYSEQYLYIDTNPDVKIHILKFEDLDRQFNKLMEIYKIDLKLDVINNQCANKIYHVKDLSRETLDLINQVYKADFELFNYKMK